jgi:hypothetical protein
MIPQEKPSVPNGQARGLALVLAVCAIAGCGGAKADAAPDKAAAAEPGAGFATVLLGTDPCSRLTPAEVSAALGKTLRGVPVRVSSAESVTPSATGSGCLYEIEPESGQEPGMVSVEVKFDGAAEMQAGLGAGVEGMFASADGQGIGKWDWISRLPAGLFAARQGHIGVLIAINASGMSPRDVEPLAAQLLARVPDLPAAMDTADPAAPGSGRNPCDILTRSEAEAVLGPLAQDPYRSRESTPIAYGNGKSCTYYAPGHHVVVLTPTWSDGPMIFGMMKGISGLTSKVTGEKATSNTAGPWDDRTTGIAGHMYFLKGERMLELQHRASGADEAAALKLASVALGRM